MEEEEGTEEATVKEKEKNKKEYKLVQWILLSFFQTDSMLPQGVPVYINCK